MFVLNLDAETGRILSATFPAYAPDGAVLAEALPEGNISDYLYRDGAFLYEPLPRPEPADPETTAEERIAALEAKNEALSTSNQFLEDCIIEMAGIVYA